VTVNKRINRRTFLTRSAAVTGGAVLTTSFAIRPSKAALKKVNFITPWSYLIGFAPVLNAHSGGHFKRHGLEVTILGGKGSGMAVRQVLTDRVQFARAASLAMVKAVGNAAMIRALFQIKANLDSGVPQAVQEMAIEALTSSQDCVDENVAIYQRRRDRVLKALGKLGLRTPVPRASLYIWAAIPEGFTSAEFAARLLDETDIVVTPGSSYGKFGEGYIRLSLTTPDDRVEEGCRRLENWTMPQLSA